MDSNTIGTTLSATAATSVAVASAAGTAASRTVATDPAPKKTGTPERAAAPKENPEPQRDPRSLQFSVEGDRVITTIIDSNDKTVVIQIPDADMIRIAKSIDRMQGFLVEEKA